MRVNVTTIRKYLLEQDKFLVKCNFKLNYQDAYKVKHKDGFRVYTKPELFEAYQEGTL